MKKIKIEYIKEQFQNLTKGALDQKNRIILFFFIGLILVGYTHIKSNPNKISKDPFQIDTLIPDGYVLIPVKLSNAAAISGVIGSYGVADIYSTLAGQKSKLLFSKAKVIKSEDAEDPVFSVLVKESRAHLLSNREDPFFAAVQNPKARAHESKIEQKIQIIYQN